MVEHPVERRLPAREFTFVKGHGAHNDFIVLPDPDDRIRLDPADVVHLCHRRAGIGADGLLRAVRCTAHPEAVGMAGEAEWFMDYRNADGSTGTMCGNGIRVLARYLADASLLPHGSTTIATRAGVRTLHIPARHSQDRTITVDMGHPRLPGDTDITVSAGGRRWPALHVDMGNPHAVAFVEDLTHPGDLRTPPAVTPGEAYPDGVTVEFVVPHTPRHLALRVHERGVGETSACGTGACAAVTALRQRERHAGAGTYTVDVPGGRLHVTVHDDGTMILGGPAVIVADGMVWLTPDAITARSR
ncbi:diaminopimelate epimerase [Streptomyces sp. NBC_00075]|uniref:Diaminopimelate epimerase n=1 Tax=Streptomyces sp. NBC_00093 TaxID=2975649 RepID=A0AAU2A8M2_9ACTN